MERFNLDYNATAGVDPRVLQALDGKRLGLNPSSIHTGGQRARALLEEARDVVREALDLERDDRVIFTSGATEANNAVLHSAYFNAKHSLSVLTSSVEHPSVLDPLARLQELGAIVFRVAPLNGTLPGREFFSRVLECKPNLVSLMFANNETGEIFDVNAASQAAHKVNALFHCDAVQALGKKAISLKRTGADLLTLSGHKFGALPGVGALIVKSSARFDPFILGGAQENHLRAGTENVLGVASFGEALRLTLDELSTRLSSMLEAREYFETQIRLRFPDTILNGALAERLPNTLNFTFPGVSTDELLVAADLKGVLISSGAACASGKPEPSHVLLAYGVPPTLARNSIRVSLPPFLLKREREEACSRLITAICECKRESTYVEQRCD